MTILPRDCKEWEVQAFDTGPGNMLMDAAAVKFSQGQLTCDKNAVLALQGKVQESILTHMLRHPFLALSPPKSTGREDFGVQYLNDLLNLFPYVIRAEDWLATLSAFTIETITDAVMKYVKPENQVKELIVSGGGMRNPVLLAGLHRKLGSNGITVKKIEDMGVGAEAKEALAFAVLAYLTRHGLPGNIPTATGARCPAVLGKIALAPCRSREGTVTAYNIVNPASGGKA